MDVIRQMMDADIPFNRWLGVRVAEIDRGRVRMEIPFRDELVGDPHRAALHGGVISMLADTAGGCAIWSALDDPRSRPQTIDLRIDYLRPGKLEALIAEATVVRAGKRVGVADIRLFHSSAPADTIATGKGVYSIRLFVPRG